MGADIFFRLIVLLLAVTSNCAFARYETFMCTANTDALQTKTSSSDELKEEIQSLKTQVFQLQTLLQQQQDFQFTTIQGIPRDCLEIYRNGTRTDGVYSISPDGRCPFLVYCDMTNGGWTLIQKRVDGKISFHRSWDDYVRGFGEIDGSHWLGLEKIHRLTRDGSQIYFDMENYEDKKEFLHYKVFTVHEAFTAYKMNVDTFNYEGNIEELLSYYNNMKFSTYDRENDLSSRNCVSVVDGAGWWYKDCWRLGGLNGVYGKRREGGIGYWTHIRHTVPIKNVAIKVKDVIGQC